MQPDLSAVTAIAVISLVGFFAVLVVATVHLTEIRKDIRLIRSLIAAFMEHKVAGTVAENKLAALVQQANKDSVSK